MTHDPRESAELEQAMLEHYRRHTEQAPSPELDARILAAAQAQAARYTPAAQKTPALSRLHGWLFGGSQRARWSMAFASIATLGLGLGLALRTQEQAPAQQYDAAPPSFSQPAPAMAPKAEMAESPAYSSAKQRATVQAEKKALAQEEPRKRSPAIISGQLHENLNQAEAAPPPAAAPFADSAAPASPAVVASKATAAAQHDQAQLQRALEQILHLQRNGEAALAEQQLHTLQQLYPQQDLREQLQRLRHERGQQ